MIRVGIGPEGAAVRGLQLTQPGAVVQPGECLDHETGVGEQFVQF